MNEEFDFDTEDTAIIFGNEFSAKDRCKQLGIQIENAKKGAGDDRFKYLCLLCFLYFRHTELLNDFDDAWLNFFFENIIPILKRDDTMKFKNPVCVVLASYISTHYDKKLIFKIDESRFKIVQNILIPNNLDYFKKNGVSIIDIIRYIRHFMK